MDNWLSYPWKWLSLEKAWEKNDILLLPVSVKQEKKYYQESPER